MSKELTEIFKKNADPDLKARLAKFFKTYFSLPIQPPAPPAPPAAAPPAVTLQEATLADGTVLKYDTPSLAQGSVVTVVGPEGEMPCPEGEHKLQDGTTIKVVSKDGKSVVESVTPGTPAPAAPAAQSAPLDPAAQIAEINKILQGYKEQFTSQKAEKDALEKELKDQKDAFAALQKEVAENKKQQSEFLTLFNEILDLPSAAPIETPKNKHEKTIEKFIHRKQPATT